MGTFGQRSEYRQGGFITDPVKYIQLANDPTKNMVDFRIINDSVLHVEYETTLGYEIDSTVTSEIHATLVTSYARLVRYCKNGVHDFEKKKEKKKLRHVSVN